MRGECRREYMVNRFKSGLSPTFVTTRDRNQESGIRNQARKEPPNAGGTT
jgi:hypothetical protein